MTTELLLPCPFCGGEPDFNVCGSTGDYTVSVFCAKCRVEMEHKAGKTIAEAAMKAMIIWNTRQETPK